MKTTIFNIIKFRKIDIIRFIKFDWTVRINNRKWNIQFHVKYRRWELIFYMELYIPFSLIICELFSWILETLHCWYCPLIWILDHRYRYHKKWTISTMLTWDNIGLIHFLLLVLWSILKDRQRIINSLLKITYYVSKIDLFYFTVHIIGNIKLFFFIGT